MMSHVTVDLHGPHFDDDDFEAVHRAVRRAARDGEEVLVIAMHGDQADPDPSPDPNERADRATRVVAPVIEALVSSHLLVAVRATGTLAGAAATLLLTADLGVVAPSTVLVPFPATSPPTPGTGWLLRRAGLARTRAAALALAGGRLSARQAQEHGLVTEVADDPAAALEAWITASGARVRLRAAVGGPTRDLAAALAHDCQLAALWPR